MLLSLSILLGGCRTGRNYEPPSVPRYEGGPTSPPPISTGVDTIDVVAFNIRYGLRIDLALELLETEPHLRAADILLLNEVDENGTWLIAEQLRMHYAYYPAVRHGRTGRDFGNAVLSRWPIVEHERIVLPYVALLQRTQRTATAATIRIGSATVRAYAAHLATFVEVGSAGRRAQLRAVMQDAERYPHAIIGGDMNDGELGFIASDHDFTWPTRNGPWTSLIGRLDHIFLKNLTLPDSASAGTVEDTRGASDHSPVWIRAILDSR